MWMIDYKLNLKIALTIKMRPKWSNQRENCYIKSEFLWSEKENVKL